VSGRIERFLFAPARATPFAALRIGLAAVLLVQALQIAPALSQLYHHGGMLRGPLLDAFGPRHMPQLGRVWSTLAIDGAGEWLALSVLGALYVGSLVGMLVGWRTRAVTFTAWLLHLVFMMLAPHTNYGADVFASAFLFYSMLGPGGEELSLDRRAGRASGRPRVTNRLLLRVMQLHLCVVYLVSGIEKASGEQWRNGEAIWRSLTTQRYEAFDFSWLAQAPWLATAAGWMVLVVEIGYAALIWPRATRRPWIAAVVAMHAGIGIFMGLHVFAAVMIVLTVSMFGVSAEPGDER
jgi:hypothetical protein